MGRYREAVAIFRERIKDALITLKGGHNNSALKRVVEIDDSHLYKSYIIFSERCELKKITVASPNIKVLKRNALIKTIKVDIATSEKCLNTQEVDQLFLKLEKYTRVDEAVKKAHIDQIQKKLSK